MRVKPYLYEGHIFDRNNGHDVDLHPQQAGPYVFVEEALLTRGGVYGVAQYWSERGFLCAMIGIVCLTSPVCMGKRYTDAASSEEESKVFSGILLEVLRMLAVFQKSICPAPWLRLLVEIIDAHGQSLACP